MIKSLMDKQRCTMFLETTKHGEMQSTQTDSAQKDNPAGPGYAIGACACPARGHKQSSPLHFLCKLMSSNALPEVCHDFCLSIDSLLQYKVKAPGRTADLYSFFPHSPQP